MDCYCATTVGLAYPEVAVRLMLPGLLTGIVHDRKLMRKAQVNIAIRWFIGYGLHEKLPDPDANPPTLRRRSVPKGLQAHGRGLQGKDCH